MSRCSGDRPAHLADVVVDAPYDYAAGTGTVVVRATVAGVPRKGAGLTVEAEVYDGDERVSRRSWPPSTAGKPRLASTAGPVEPWSAEVPRLYEMVVYSPQPVTARSSR